MTVDLRLELETVTVFAFLRVLLCRSLGATVAHVRGLVQHLRKVGHKAATCRHGKEKQVHQIQSRAGTISSSSSQSTVATNGVSAKEIGLIESVQEDEEMGWLFMIADAVAINQLSVYGAHSLVADSGAYVLCVPKVVPLTPLQSLSGCWRGWDLRSASGKMLKVWRVRVVAFNSEDPICCL